MTKRFYIFAVDTKGEVELTFHKTFDGTLVDARLLLKGDEFAPGSWLILEDTSGKIVKTTQTVSTPVLAFETPEGRKRPRKAAAGAE